MDNELLAKLERQRRIASVSDEEHTGNEACSLSTASSHASQPSPTSERSHSSLSDQENLGDSELARRLARRQDINEGRQPAVNTKMPHQSVYAEFHEFSRKQIKDYEKTFRKYDENCDHFIDFEELKRMMEKLGEPQTHLSLKAMIKEVDEDGDGKISFREFLLIFRKAAEGLLLENSGLSVLASKTCVDVTKEGVGGAKNFFEAKVEQLTQSCKFEQEIKQEQEEKRKELEEKKQRREEFNAKKSLWK